MTCIVAYTNGIRSFIAGDKMGSNSNTRNICLDPKIFEKQLVKRNVDGTNSTSVVAMGGTTSFRMLQLLEYNLCLPAICNGMTFYTYIITVMIPLIRKLFKEQWDDVSANQSIAGGSFIILYEHVIYEVFSDFSVLRSDKNYASCGFGEYHAKGAIAAFEKVSDVFENISNIFDIVACHTTCVSSEHDVLMYED